MRRRSSPGPAPAGRLRAARMRPPATVGVVGVLALAGCTGADPGAPVAQVTVTETVEVTAPGGAGATAAPPSADTPPATTAGSGADPAADEEGGLSDVHELAAADAAQEAGVSGDGAVAGLGFRDVNGANTVVLREVPVGTGRQLFADHVAYFAMTDEREVLREVRDGVDDCGWGDLTAQFVPQSLAVHDDDGDAVGEVTFTYHLACRTDVSAAEQKLLVLEDGRKYILRGHTSTPYQPFEDPVPEPAADQWPAGAYERAVARFRELAPEFSTTST